ncbi:hypothetical protein AMTRI_Chr03g142670 [Amborella trichopoda]|uniref:Uncharacterized protein n=1 Tax=Amborella trichopoda TaxID=13333 RepID=W1NXZ7_AMBTC|nr:hypothetical protein AMTR_s00083p00040600 [Amborella trichopoda]
MSTCVKLSAHDTKHMLEHWDNTKFTWLKIFLAGDGREIRNIVELYVLESTSSDIKGKPDEQPNIKEHEDFVARESSKTTTAANYTEKEGTRTKENESTESTPGLETILEREGGTSNQPDIHQAQKPRSR